MDQGADKLDRPGDSVRVRGARISASSPPEVEDVPVEAQEIERTRAHMSETIEEIQDRFNPAQVAGEAKDTAAEVTEDVKEVVTETVDHALQEARTTVEEWSELARVAALETVDHAIEEAKAALPTVTEQARDLAQQTIDHAILEAKTAIRELGDQARGAVRDATIGKVERMAHTTGESTKSFSSSLMTTIKQNPGPAALTGLGIGWLMMSGKSASSQGQTSTSSTGQYKGTSSDVSGQVKDAAGQVKGKAGDAADQAQDAAGKAVDQAQDAAGKVTDQVQQAASMASDQAHQAADTVTTQAQQLSARFRRTLDEKPLAVGLVATALGSAAALVVPVTQRENQMLGGARDKVMDRAQTGAQDVLQKVQRVAEEAGEAAEKEAKYQGISPEK